MSKKVRAIGKNHYHTNHNTKKSHRPKSKFASLDPRANSYISSDHRGFGEEHYQSPFEQKRTIFGRVKAYLRSVFFKKTVKAPSMKTRISQFQNPIGVNVKENPLKEVTRVHQRKGER